MTKEQNHTFHITVPDVRTTYLGKGVRQKASYLQLPNDFGEKLFQEDVKAGAEIYEPFCDTLKLKDSQYNVILTPTQEDGLRAVAYLAGIHAEKEGYEKEQWKDEHVGADGPSFCEFDETIDELLEDDEEEDCEEECVYEESFDRIPLLALDEVAAQERRNDPTFSFNMFNMAMDSNVKQMKPWWIDCLEQSVCLIHDHAEGLMMFSGESLRDDEIECLKRFHNNEHIYIVIVGEAITEEDTSITKFILDYTANCFKTESDEKTISRYYTALLRAEAAKRRFTFSKTVDVPLLTEKLSRIDRQFPCGRFSKIMDYLIHINAPKCLKSKDFDRLGLKNLIEQVSADEVVNSMETELVGMEQVKEQVNNIMDMLRYCKLREKKNISKNGYHNVHLFVGAPGTAKTTVAKMMAKAMQREGLLPGNRFISVTGVQLKGAYLGQTAPKVHALFQEHDAIFIDEAYSLACSDHEGPDLYAQEALAQLAVELEEHGTEKLVIFAGYGGNEVSKQNNLMKRFLETNPGISSRINSTVFFDSYTPKNMVEIVHRLADLSKLHLGTEADQDIASYFQTRQSATDFGNGREARVLLEQCERSLAGRVAKKDPDAISEKELNTLEKDDVLHAIGALKKKHLVEQGKCNASIGFA